MKAWSKIGFGAAKAHLTPSSECETALRLAIKGGINVIDTSANYSNGGSEELIGKVVSSLDPNDKESFTIVSKFGYCKDEKGQGRHQLRRPPGALPVFPGVLHSMHPEFMEGELTDSTKRLAGKPDIYMIHNPETYISCMLAKAKKDKGGSEQEEDMNTPPDPLLLEESREKCYASLTVLFSVLEECVSRGDIGSYGVSSHGLSLDPTDPLYIDWRRLLETASEGSRLYRGGLHNTEKGSGEYYAHAMSAVQMPGNLLETLGIAQAPMMAAAGLRVMLTRPLTYLDRNMTYRNVVKDEAMEPPDGYMDTCRAVLEHFSAPQIENPTEEDMETIQGCQFMQQLIQDMNRQLGSFDSYDHLQQDLTRSIIPMIDEKFEELDAMSVEHLGKFFESYGDLVKYNCAQRTLDKIRKEYPTLAQDTHCDDMLGQSLKWLQSRPGVSTTLVGLANPEHVKQALAVMQK